MIEFGATLRRAREEKGMSANELAQATHLMVQQIEALEREDFSKIAAPIYGRGFVRLYCEAVGLEVQPMIDEFMDLFSGNREPTIRMRQPKAPPPVVAEPMPVDDLGMAADDEGEDALAGTEIQPELPAEEQPFTLESEIIPPPRPPMEKTSSPQSLWTEAIQPDEPELPLEEEPLAGIRRGPSRYSKPMPIDDDRRRFQLPSFNLPPMVWRLLALAGAALLLLWLMIAGCSALYRASVNEPEPNNDTVTASPATPAETTEQGTPAPRSRSLKTIPALYID